jgi:hypothetical protein
MTPKFLRFLVSTVPILFFTHSAVAQQTDSEPIIEYNKSADAIVIQMTSFSGNSGSSTIPILRIYGDGRVLIFRANRPEGQRFFEYRLSEDGLAELLRFMYDNNAMNYEYGVVEHRLKEEADRRRAAARGDRIEHGPGGLPSDGTTTIIEVFLEKFRLAGSEQPVQTNFYHKTGGYATTVVARSLPQLKEAQDLSAVILRLSVVIRNPQRQLLPEAAQPRVNTQ